MSPQSEQKMEPVANSPTMTLEEKDADIEKSATSPTSFSTTESARESASEAATSYPPRSVLIVLTLALMLVVAMSGLDTNIIGTATPRITTEFNSLNDVGWYGSAYLLALLSLQALYGNLYRLWSLKWLYVAAIATFELGSIICAVAPNSAVLILGRAVAGSGAAGTFSGTLAIAGGLVPLKKKPLYISLVSSFFGIAAAIAPILGGVFTNSRTLTWRFCFWLNLPIGGLAAFIVVFGYKPGPHLAPPSSLLSKLKRLDLGGSAILIASMVCLLLALQWGGIKYSWGDSRVYGCLLGFVLLLGAFIVVQVLRKDEATIPLRVLRQRSVAFGCLFVFCINVSHYTLLYYLPFYFQAVQNVSARTSGVRMLPYILAIFITATMVGAIMTKTGIYVPFMWISAAIYAVGCGLLHTLSPSSGAGHWISWQIIAGIGFGMGFQIPFTVVQSCLEGPDIIVGNGIVVFSQALGGAVAVSIGQNVFSNTLRSGLNTKGLGRLQGIASAGAAEIGTRIPAQFQDQVHGAFSYAVSQTLVLAIAGAAAGFFCSLGMQWRRVEKKA